MSNKKIDLQRGFTIIELMIATSVLSVILLFVSVVMVNIGNLYYKGINQARIQDTVRNLADDISQHLQLNDTDITPAVAAVSPLAPTVNAYCVGTTRYTFVLYRKLGTDVVTGDKTNHVLWRDTVPPKTCVASKFSELDSLSGGSQLPGGSDGTELMSPNARLTAFTLVSRESPFSLAIGVAYGDRDLLTNPDSIDANCKGGKGEKFCATASQKNIIVARRLNTK